MELSSTKVVKSVSISESWLTVISGYWTFGWGRSVYYVVCTQLKYRNTYSRQRDFTYLSSTLVWLNSCTRVLDDSDTVSGTRNWNRLFVALTNSRRSL